MTQSGEAVETTLGDPHNIFDAHAELTQYVYPLLNRENHAWFKYCLVLRSDPQGLTNFQSQPLTGAVDEVLVLARFLQRGTRGTIDIAAGFVSVVDLQPLTGPKTDASAFKERMLEQMLKELVFGIWHAQNACLRTDA